MIQITKTQVVGGLSTKPSPSMQNMKQNDFLLSVKAECPSDFAL